ncbi:MAG: ribose-phosphate pyrophosphokinase, ribose-phosphate pyrophosphokinase [Candidatus Gottesmanbacteria bacterium GW2011_GWA2_43_14]|uniref:ribose-phosphate diphosphokinase n=1 Tax=Candidatus Gottesmanbacteria bacterium GW2011_GWA2_43_14 TaxID=1618443 RepID=A0A0G1DJS2_9BACT|nr:MAG: ribose-phosphate pyrophosphokinase, ribose-phosphate pyrophosphokinase [Candidatus Gottesmanbacteria bacterium GW2011_GWA2_43_14]
MPQPAETVTAERKSAPDNRLQEIAPAIAYDSNGIVLITGLSNPELASSIGELLAKKVDNSITIFPDGESLAQLSGDLRKKHAFIIQPTSPPVNENIMQTLLIIDAARRASAGEITAVIPYFGYARQDRKNKPKVSISAAMVADLLVSAGADRIVTIDIHSTQAQGFVKIPWDNLYASSALVPIMKAYGLGQQKVLTPDLGGSQRAGAYAQLLGENIEMAAVYKQRDTSGRSKALFLSGDVDGYDIWIVDDLGASLRTLVDAAVLAKEKGAQRIAASIAHGLFLGDALEKLDNSPIEILLVTDTINHRTEVRNHPKIQIVSIAPLLAKAIQHIHTGQELEELFI